jgi:hypothetical protein
MKNGRDAALRRPEGTMELAGRFPAPLQPGCRRVAGLPQTGCKPFKNHLAWPTAGQYGLPKANFAG